MGLAEEGAGMKECETDGMEREERQKTFFESNWKRVILVKHQCHLSHFQLLFFCCSKGLRPAAVSVLTVLDVKPFYFSL